MAPTLKNEGGLDVGALLALVATGVSANGGDYASLKASLREGVKKDPLDALVVTVLGGSMLFYLAEKDDNPKVQTPWDALVYVSTCLSVGYADIFARTPGGKAIGSLLMTYGPALSARALDAPGAPAAPVAPGAPQFDEAAVERIVGRLDSILNELRARAT